MDLSVSKDQVVYSTMARKYLYYRADNWEVNLQTIYL